jgi:thimet oligopeptidase
MSPIYSVSAAGNPAGLAAFQNRAAKFNAVVSLPTFESTPAELKATVAATVKHGNAGLDAIAALDPRKTTFENTARAIDNLGHATALVLNRLSLIKETSTEPAMRDTATEELKNLMEWMVGLEYREDVFKTVQAYADRKPRLKGEDAKLLNEILRDYRRAGLALPRAQRDEVEALRKELTRLSTDFESNINKAQAEMVFSKSDLEGVPDSFLEQARAGDQYKVMANITWHYLAVMENARKEETRKRLLLVRDNLAREQNIALLEKILALRNDIARKLRYATWADYQTEVKMARNGQTAIRFLEELKEGLNPKFDAEVAEFRALKARETGDANAQIHIWDWRYYSNQLKKEKYTVDAEQLRVFFPYQRVLDGMFAIYQKIFGLTFERVDAPSKWIGDLQLYAVSDAKSGEPMGLFYLDMFPRQGKFNHFAVFGLIDGKLMPDGKYQRPVVAMICNFPAPTTDKPSLLSHEDVETLFHEFGHVMHGLLTRAHHARFSGSNVPRDFVEAPSQMLENWVWDKTVLDSFAADYRDPSRKIPADILGKLKEARLGIEGTRYRRQLSFGLTDLVLHTQITSGNANQVVPLSNQVLGDVFFPMAPDTAFVAYFGHLVGYDAGYYGYAWADAIAADMATVFERAKKGYWDESAGRRLRKEIYEPGDSRDVNVSIEKFLARKRSLDPFLKKLGISN